MPKIRNPTLRSLNATQLRLLRPIELVEWEQDQVVYRPRQPITDLYFLETGMGSILRPTREGKKVEIWPYGCASRSFIGAYGLPFPWPETIFEYRVRTHATAWRVSREVMREAMRRNRRLNALMERISWVLHMAIVQMLVCNNAHRVEQRLARQLLLLRYVLGSDRLPFTRQMLADMVLTRREYLYQLRAGWGRCRDVRPRRRRNPRPGGA